MATKGYWTPARKRAFAKMRAGLKRKVGGGASRKRRKSSSSSRVGVTRLSVKRRRTVRRNPMTALLANPSFGYTPAYSAGYGNTFAKSRRKRKVKGMAKRRRKKSSGRVRRRKGAKRRVIRRAKRVTKARAHRYYKSRRGRIYLNPRTRSRRRRKSSVRRRRSVRRNGKLGLMQAVKSAFMPFLVGALTGGAAAILEANLAKYPTVRNLAKVAGVVGVAVFLGRKNPRMAAAAIGALAASTGYALAIKYGGGMIARTPEEAVKGLGEMADTYPEMGALLNGGLGALLNGEDGMGGIPNVGAGVQNYEQALMNMAGDDDE